MRRDRMEPKQDRWEKERRSSDESRFLQTHLVGIREHASHFVPITGKPGAQQMMLAAEITKGPF